MITYNIDDLYTDGYFFYLRGWIVYTGIPSWQFSKMVTLTSENTSQNIIPEMQLRRDVSSYLQNHHPNTNVDYEQCGFRIKILKQNLPNDYFKINITVKSKEISETVTLKQMIYI